MNKVEIWTLAVVLDGTGEDPWCSLHTTYRGALGSLHDTFGIGGPELLSEDRLADILDGRACFTIEKQTLP